MRLPRYVAGWLAAVSLRVRAHAVGCESVGLAVDGLRKEALGAERFCFAPFVSLSFQRQIRMDFLLVV